MKKNDRVLLIEIQKSSNFFIENRNICSFPLSLEPIRSLSIRWCLKIAIVVQKAVEYISKRLPMLCCQ